MFDKFEVSMQGVINICKRIEYVSGQTISEAQKEQIFQLCLKYAEHRKDYVTFAESVTGLFGYYS